MSPSGPAATEWSLPFGSFSPGGTVAMFARRHMHEFGTTREQVGAIAVNARTNAMRNPKALLRTPMTLDDYLSSRMIVEPFALYDCDIYCDGSVAVVISAAEYAADAPRPPIRIEAIGTAQRGRPSFEYWEDYAKINAWNAASHMWNRTSLRPSDMQFGQLYDGFTWLTLFWIEALGFCGHGEGGPFVEGGARIAPDGELPINTDGGQLSAGRLHGWGYIHEACTQLWGHAGERQLDRHDIGVVAMGGGPVGGCMILRND
jgi:acetyl-CoA acetyltransferase